MRLRGVFSRRPWGLVGRTLGSRTGDRVSGCEVRPCAFSSMNISINQSIYLRRRGASAPWVEGVKTCHRTSLHPRPHPGMVTLQDWYMEVPLITRVYLTSSMLTTAACSLELVSPFSLFFNMRLVFVKLQARHPAHGAVYGAVHGAVYGAMYDAPSRGCGLPPESAQEPAGGAMRGAYINHHTCGAAQVWRLFTNFFFFGAIGLDFFFHMFFLVRYCRMLEEGSFRGRPADFLLMLLFGGA